MNSKIQQLKNKLSQLIELDKSFEVFGSESHRYKLNPCISIAQIQTIESHFQIQLPEDYRDFLLEIGNGGAGPGYGLLGVDTTLIDVEKTQPDCFSQVFSLTQEWNNLDLLQLNNGKSVSEYFDDKFIRGTISVADYGCGIQARLVITGEQRGGIWIDDRTNEAGIYPLTSHCAAFFHDDPDIDTDIYESIEEEKDALSFYDWYENWLNRSINQVIRFGQ